MSLPCLRPFTWLLLPSDNEALAIHCNLQGSAHLLIFPIPSQFTLLRAVMSHSLWPPGLYPPGSAIYSVSSNTVGSSCFLNIPGPFLFWALIFTLWVEWLLPLLFILIFSNLKAKFTSARRTSLSCFSEAASPRYSIASLCLFPLLHSNRDYLTHYFFFVDCLLQKNVSTMKAEACTNLLTLNPQSLA